MNDEIIIDYFINKETLKIYSGRVNKKNIEKNTPEMAEYLRNRFPESFTSYSEVIARIYYDIEKIPTCRICGKQLKFKTLKKPYGSGKWCSCQCQLKDSEFIEWRSGAVDYKEAYQHQKETLKRKYGDEKYSNREKAKKTCLERYGAETCFSSESSVRQKLEADNLEKYGKRTTTNVEKIRQTKEERYGDPGYCNREQIEKTMVERYGYKTTLESPVLKEKVKKTKLEKYGNEYYTDRAKAEQTCFEHYGVKNSFQLPSVRKKINYDKGLETKRKNGTLRSSKIEEEMYRVLTNLYGESDVLKQYKDERYKNPKNNRKYLCDFYIKSLDLFIESQCHYTHGKHPYDEKNEEDVLLRKKIEEKISKNKPSYKKVIEVWCEADVTKRNIAKEHNLNYLEIFELKFTEETVKEKIENYLRTKQE
jgi:hypothetical protein